MSTVIVIGFDPKTLKPSDEAYPAFAVGGMPLKMWALVKRQTITGPQFRTFLVKFAGYMEDAFDPECEDVQPYQNIDEFVSVLKRCGLGETGISRQTNFSAWLVENWDYFNLNIQKSIVLEYKVMELVTKQLNIEVRKP
jgi:hypothetical protein